MKSSSTRVRQTHTLLCAVGIPVAALTAWGLLLGLGGQDGPASLELWVHTPPMTPSAFDDRWHITPEGYRIPPGPEGVTPGLALGFAFRIGGYLEAGFNVLAGMYPASPGIIDDSPQRESRGSQGMELLTLRFSTALAFTASQEWSLSLRPLLEYTWIQTRKATHTSAPSSFPSPTDKGVPGNPFSAGRR